MTVGSLKGKVAEYPDHWTIDGNVFEFKNHLYGFVWLEGDTNGQQNIYIAKMKNS